MPDNPIKLEDLEKPKNTGYKETNKYGDDDWATPPKEEIDKKKEKDASSN